jgi:iron complex outermembrane receptor protein
MMSINITNRTTTIQRAVRAVLGAAVVSAALSAAPAGAAEETSTTLSEVVVTGSIIRRTEAETASPISVITAEDLDDRAQTSVQSAIQTISANNGPALTNSFTANGAFAAGASAVSLRGLSTSSTLVLFDGMRAAYYPLADDGARNFVDLNSIQDDIIEKIDVLRDGASSSYGADAIAGVVNIITKRQYTGVGGRVEVGRSERGDAGNMRLSVIAGKGDIETDGFNTYLSAFYTHSDSLKNNTRDYPYNTDDQRGICFEGNCGGNAVINGLNQAGILPALGVSSQFLVRPALADNSAVLTGSRYQPVNPAAGCGVLTPHTLTPAELALAGNAAAPPTVCQESLTNLYDYILPELTRFGFSGKATVKLSDTSEAYAALNFLQSSSEYFGRPATIRANAPAGIIYPIYSTSAGATILTLPVWVCPGRVNCADPLTFGRRLNPNNPFAAAGNPARLLGRLQDEIELNQTQNRVYRFASGVRGKAWDWDYDLGVTLMHTDLKRTQDGYVYIQHLLDVINDGSYNFVNPSQNTKTVRDYVTPESINPSSSDLYQAQLNVSRPLFDLPGGPMLLGLGATMYYEAVNAPSGNPDYNGSTQRYFRLNAFGTSGSRNVYAGYFEVEAPIIKMVTLNVAGRYDAYQTGQSNFSPKFGVKFTPIDMLAIRGTYSKGFRIPSFAESNALPTTGFVTASQGIYPDSYLAGYGCSQATFASCPTYIRSTSYGLTSLGSPNLEPEESTSYTFGIVLEPFENISMTLDYYDIEKTKAITPANASPAIAAYYNNQPIPAGYTVIPGNPDVNNPTLKPTIGFVQSGYVNSNTVRSKGYDFSVTGAFTFGSIKWKSMLEASYIDELSTSFPDGTTESYAGTLGNFNLTAGSGTPQWRGSWINTVTWERLSGSLTLNYFDGYNLSAEDQTGPDTAGDCGLSSGITPCDVSSYMTIDLVGNFNLTDNMTLYANVVNVADKMPPIDPVTYGANNYNPVQGGEGIIGRAYRLGVRLKF